MPGEKKGRVSRAAGEGTGQKSTPERGPPEPKIRIRHRREHTRDEWSDLFASAGRRQARGASATHGEEAEANEGRPADDCDPPPVARGRAARSRG